MVPYFLSHLSVFFTIVQHSISSKKKKTVQTTTFSFFFSCFFFSSYSSSTVSVFFRVLQLVLLLHLLFTTFRTIVTYPLAEETKNPDTTCYYCITRRHLKERRRTKKVTMRAYTVIASLAALASAAPVFPELNLKEAISPDATLESLSDYFNTLATRVQLAKVMSSAPECDLSKAKMPSGSCSTSLKIYADGEQVLTNPSKQKLILFPHPAKGLSPNTSPSAVEPRITHALPPMPTQSLRLPAHSQLSSTPAALPPCTPTCLIVFRVWPWPSTSATQSSSAQAPFPFQVTITSQTPRRRTSTSTRKRPSLARHGSPRIVHPMRPQGRLLDRTARVRSPG